MVSELIFRQSAFLKRLSTTKSHRVREQLLSNASEEQLLSIFEICINILRFRFRLLPQTRRRLAAHALLLRALSRARTPNRVRHLLRTSNGKIFKPLLTPVLRQLRLVAKPCKSKGWRDML